MFALLTHTFGLAAGSRSSYQKNMERVAQDLISILGKDKLLKMMTPEERVRGLTPEERLRGLTLEDIRSLDTQTLEKLKQLIFSTAKTEN